MKKNNEIISLTIYYLTSIHWGKRVEMLQSRRIIENALILRIKINESQSQRNPLKVISVCNCYSVVCQIFLPKKIRLVN